MRTVIMCSKVHLVLPAKLGLNNKDSAKQIIVPIKTNYHHINLYKSVQLSKCLNIQPFIMVPYGQLEDHSDFLESAAEKKIYHCKIYKKIPSHGNQMVCSSLQQRILKPV